jgi:UDP-N-acetylglucosamine/UDP-N-acetylgalactosamine diphosphorylase
MSYESTLAHLEEHGQGHLLAFYHQLPEDQQSSLLSQIKSIDIPRVNRIFQTAIKADKDAAEDESKETLEPLPSSDTASTTDPKVAESSVPKWKETGMKAIREGKVGIILMAGGQGTRLGSSAPKGCYDIGLPSGKTLFRMQGERIKKLDQLAGGEKGLVWYVMTSGPTRKETEKYFRDSGFFGLDAENVVFFDQGEFKRVGIPINDVSSDLDICG